MKRQPDATKRENSRPRKFPCATRLACSLALVAALTQLPASLAVEYANLSVDAAGTVTIAGGESTAGFSITGSGTTGVIPIQIGPSASDDAAGGVLIGSISENGRPATLAGGGSETLYSTSATAPDGSGGLNLITRRASEDTPNTLFLNGALHDANLSAAYFPFSAGWVGGSASASTGDVFNTFNLNGMTAANISQNLFGTGDNFVSIPGVDDTRRQGILLASHASNSNVYTLSTPTAGGDGFNLTTKANNTNGSAGTNGGSISFVFVPRNTPGLTMGRAHGGNSAHQASLAFQSGDAVSISREAAGRYRLSIAGQSPTTGALLVGTHGSNDGDNGRASDNVATYAADGNDWIVLAQDLATLDGNGQDTNESEYYFDFAFLPFSGGPTGPGAVPPVGTLTTFSKSRVLAWNSEVAELTSGNAPGETLTTIAQSTSDVTITPLGFNRGDNSYAVDGGFFALSDGVMLGTIREGLRDNSATGGFTEYGILSTNSRDGEWQVATHTSNAAPGGSTEFNINHAISFFGADTGFQMGNDRKVDMATSALSLTLSGVDPEANGVLLANPATNEDNFVTVTPQGQGGEGWDILLLDNSTEPEQVINPDDSDGFNYVYLPYESDNLVAGVVQADASVVNSTDTNEFTLTKVGVGEYKLTITGKTPDTGMLLLNATAEGDGDNSVVYEDDPDGVSFRIIGIDHATVDEIENQFLLPNPEDTGFSFAYIDFEEPPTPPTSGADADADGDVDPTDFVIWQRTNVAKIAPWQMEFGTGVGGADAVAAVPEPSAAALLAVGVLLGTRRPGRRRRP